MTSKGESEPLLAPGQATSMHVNRAIDGDSRSLDWLVERLDPLLQAQASYRMGPIQQRICDPRDVVQEAWLVLLPRLGSLPPRDGRMTPVLLSFLSTTIINKLNNVLRAELRRDNHEAEAAHAQPDALDEVAARVEQRETQTHVNEAIAELVTQDREILILRGIEQRPADEVAQLLDLSKHAVHKRYSRALERLRARLPHSVFGELPDAIDD